MLLATVFVLTFMIAQPINRVPDETNHARMTWEIFHKPTVEHINGWIKSHPSECSQQSTSSCSLREDRSGRRRVYLCFNLKAISFLPQLLGMTLGSLLYPSVGFIMMLGRLFNALAYIFGVYLLIKYFKYGKKLYFSYLFCLLWSSRLLLSLTM